MYIEVSTCYTREVGLSYKEELITMNHQKKYAEVNVHVHYLCWSNTPPSLVDQHFCSQWTELLPEWKVHQTHTHCTPFLVNWRQHQQWVKIGLLSLGTILLLGWCHLAVLSLCAPRWGAVWCSTGRLSLGLRRALRVLWFLACFWSSKFLEGRRHVPTRTQTHIRASIWSASAYQLATSITAGVMLWGVGIAVSSRISHRSSATTAT